MPRSFASPSDSHGPAEPDDRSDRVCIVGAGPSGLLAARSLRGAGLAYDQFERNPDVGGIWDIRNDWSPMYESAHLISSKATTHLPGFPMPESYPDYPGHADVFAYLQSFARAYDLYDGIDFGVSVTRIDRDDRGWIVATDDGRRARYRALFLCSGNTWDPNLPAIEGDFDGETMHSLRYRSPDVFRGRRVLVVGGGNSGCDIACDAARYADRAFLSLRRGYHFIPKYLLGKPTDVFASGVNLPRWAEIRAFETLLRLTVGDLTRYGLPRPDHRVLESHPIMNTEVLHHLGHGDLVAVPDVARFDGDEVRFADNRTEPIDLVVFATGYKVTYPFMDRAHFRWVGKYPDLYLSALHRDYDDLCCLGLHQTDGTALDLFGLMADAMTNFLVDQEHDPARARRFRERKRQGRPDLSGGRAYVASERHATYVKRATYLRHVQRMFRQMGWRHFGDEVRPRPAEATPPRSTASASAPRVSAAARS